MTDTQPNTNETAPDETPALHFAHRHAITIEVLLLEADERRFAHLDTNGKLKKDASGKSIKPDADPFGALFQYLVDNKVVTRFPCSNGKDEYILTSVEDFRNMTQDDFYMLRRALNATLYGSRLVARDAAKK